MSNVALVVEHIYRWSCKGWEYKVRFGWMLMVRNLNQQLFTDDTALAADYEER